MKKWILAIIFVVSALVGIVFYWTDSTGSLNRPEVDWRLLNQYDYIAKKSTDELDRFDNVEVKIPGFMVPLEDNQNSVTEFLLVPNPQACIHVPPPPPNQMVYVRMKKGQPAAQGPIWVYGKLKINAQNSQYGEVSFELIGDFIEPYK